MSRSLRFLCILLLSLCGWVTPSLACSVMPEQRDCCPEGVPCETERSHPAQDPAALVCCAPAATSNSSSVSTQQHHDEQTSLPAEGSAQPGFVMPRAPPVLLSRAPIDPPLIIPQQDTYLRTGRLRL
ncbi:hypothetical protein [Peristeroidobacter soli]|jgi:hypothetical protein|uniref:hypothetical protein n=1 Tax=Peristeroidobacter soli TaxID=2497877 RepID=UPI00101B8C60|nr:hypothetical protein [Peristeroidobacter soli]